MIRIIEFYKYEAELGSCVRVLAPKSTPLHIDEDHREYCYGEFVKELDCAKLEVEETSDSPEYIISIRGSLDFILHVAMWLLKHCDICVLTSEKGYSIAECFQKNSCLTLGAQLPLSNERMITITSQFNYLALLIDKLRLMAKARAPYSIENLSLPRQIPAYSQYWHWAPSFSEDRTEVPVLAERPQSKPIHVTQTITLPSYLAARLAGKGCENMLRLRRRTGVNIRITRLGAESAIAVRGHPTKVANALKLITKRSI